MLKAALRLVGASSILLIGCGTALQSSGGVVPGKAVQPHSKIVLIAFPDAIDKGGSTIGGSGGATTAAVRDALVAHAYSPIVGDSKTLSDAFAEAEKLGYSYVLKGSLINWEDNATEWSMRPDTAGLSLELYDVGSKSLVASSTENVRASYISYTAGSPDRFAPALADLALGRIFGWQPSQASLNPK
jgi:hypothetical protein